MRVDPLWHLFDLSPGQRFTLAREDSAIYSVVEVGPDNAIGFLDPDGQPISSRAIALLNRNSYFVHLIRQPTEVSP